MFNIRTKISGETGLATAESPMQRNICPVHVSSIDIEMKRILGSWAGERNTKYSSTVHCPGKILFMFHDCTIFRYCPPSNEYYPATGDRGDNSIDIGGWRH